MEFFESVAPACHAQKRIWSWYHVDLCRVKAGQMIGKTNAELENCFVLSEQEGSRRYYSSQVLQRLTRIEHSGKNIEHHQIKTSKGKQNHAVVGIEAEQRSRHQQTENLLPLRRFLLLVRGFTFFWHFLIFHSLVRRMIKQTPVCWLLFV